MENQIQNLLNKYEAKPLNSIKFEDNILDIEKNIIFEKESQIPNFVLASNCPFDKNYCFKDINLTASTKENIFPKQKYFLKSQQIIELKPVDINKIFDDDKIFINDKNSQNNDDINKNDDENFVHNKIISTIESHHYKNYIPKKKYLDPNQINNEWYIIGKNKNEGPFNDFVMYNKLYYIYNECISKKEKIPNYLINEKRSDTFMTMEDCFDRLKSKFEYIKQNNSNSLNNQFATLQYINNINMMLYRYQIMQNYLMNKNISNLNYNNQINQNKINSPNKFDINNNENNRINNNKNDNNEKKEKVNINNTTFNNYNKNKWKNNKNKGKNKSNNFNNNNYYHQNKYNRKENRYKENEVKENKDESNENKDGKVDNNNGNNTVEENKEEEKRIYKVENVEEWFEKE